MKRVECTQCDKTFTKGNIKAAEQALMMHVGRVHTGTISNSRGVIRRDTHENNGHDHAHTNGEHNHAPEMKPKRARASKLSTNERDGVVTFIREHHTEYPTKSACFRAAMKSAGATGKIKENSVAVNRHFVMAMATAAAAAKAQPDVKPRRYRRDTVDKVLFAHAAQEASKCDCPNCHYDYNLLISRAIPAKHCPGCGASIRRFIDQLLNLVTVST